MLKFLLISYIITMLILIVLAFCLYQFHVPQGFIQGGIIFAYVCSCFIGGMLLAKGQQSRRYLYGLVLGIAYFLVIFIISLLLNCELLSTVSNMLSVFFMCSLGGMLGGMLTNG